MRGGGHSNRGLRRAGKESQLLICFGVVATAQLQEERGVYNHIIMPGVGYYLCHVDTDFAVLLSGCWGTVELDGIWIYSRCGQAVRELAARDGFSFLQWRVFWKAE